MILQTPLYIVHVVFSSVHLMR